MVVSAMSGTITCSLLESRLVSTLFRRRTGCRHKVPFTEGQLTLRLLYGCGQLCK